MKRLILKSLAPTQENNRNNKSSKMKNEKMFCDAVFFCLSERSEESNTLHYAQIGRRCDGKRGHFHSFLFIFFYLFTTLAFAQLEISPIGPNQQSKYQNARVAAVDTVQIPFFDDFASSKNGILNPRLWKSEGGTYVSNTMTIDHPSLNVVVFDGTDFSGRPYNFSSNIAQGYTDTLSSQPIDLGGLKQTDAVYLSYYFRREGLGEFPDKGDSIFVQFKNKDGGWDKVWGTDSGKLDSLKLKPGFIFNTIAVSVNYLYRGFQFRFRTKGRQSGRFDNWFVDYVYLNKKRSQTDQYLEDAALVLPISPFLKRYSSMPLKQFLVNPAKELADSVGTSLIYLVNSSKPIITRFTLQNDSTKSIVQRTTFVQKKPNGSLDSSFDTSGNIFFAKKIKPLPFTIDGSIKKLKSLSFTLKFFAQTTDNINKTVDVDRQLNDTISSKVILDNYYAYDDGSAEYAVYMNKPQGRVAVKFVLNKQDTLGGVKMNINPILANIDGQSFTIFVWKNDNGKPGTITYQQAFKAQYAPNRDQFIDFPFSKGVIIEDSIFYVGWMQISQTPIAVGLDRNNKRSDKIFVNTGQQWNNYTDFKDDASLIYFDGSLLLRPYTGAKATKDLLLATQKEVLEDWKIYPNPTDGLVRWDTEEVKEVQVFSISGSTVLQSFQVADKQINISSLPIGQYLIRLSNSKRSVVHKVLKL